MSIKVCHLTSVHQRYDTRIFIKQCTSLSKHYDTYLVVSDGLGNEKANNISIYDIGKLEGRINRVIRSTQAIFKKALELDAHIYHLHDPELIPIGLRLKQYGKKVIFDAHEDLPNQIQSKHYIKPVFRKPISMAVRLLEKKTCCHFDAIVAATPTIRDKFYDINKNTIDINNYPKMKEFTDEVKKDKKNQICYIGGLSSERGLKEIILATELTKNKVTLKIAGNFTETALSENIHQTKGWDNVNYVGFVSREDVKDILTESLAGLVTLHPTLSYMDSLPVKMFEYMSSGIPVIASNFPLWQSIINDAKCGLCVDPLNPKDLALAIDYLVENPIEAANMGRNGKSSIAKKYNWDIEEAKLLKLYKKTLEI